MKWFRSYHSDVDDRTLQTLSAALFKHFYNLQCIASAHDPRGSLPEPHDIAFRLRLRPSRILEVIDLLLAAGLLERSATGGLAIAGWHTAQRASDASWPRPESRQEKPPVPEKTQDAAFYGSESYADLPAIYHTFDASKELIEKKTLDTREVRASRLDTDTDKSRGEKIVVHRNGGRADPSFDAFASAYLEARELSYQSTSGDFVQLAKLRTRCSLQGKVDPPGWASGVTHYFASELGKFTMADLCVRFDVFRRAALDRYGKPESPIREKSLHEQLFGRKEIHVGLSQTVDATEAAIFALRRAAEDAKARGDTAEAERANAEADKLLGP